MAASATWDDLLLIVRGLSNRKNGPPVTGDLLIADESILAALKACHESESDTHLCLANGAEPSALAIGQTVAIEVSPRFGFGLLTSNVGSLLRAQYARVKEPLHFYLLDDGLANSDVAGEEHILTRYRAVLSFIQTLKQSAAFLDSDGPSLIFISDGKFEIAIDYDENDLTALSRDEMTAINRLLPDGTHADQCSAIMAESAVDMTKHLASYNRFKYLLAHLADFKKRYEDGYKLYASGFSYERVRDQVEAARVDYTGKIHKVFADIQNQLLSIPVATIIVATQMKDAKAVGYEFWINTAVLVGCWVFAVLMIFLLHNQAHTLDVLRDEIARQKRQLTKDFAGVAEQFSGTFKHLARRECTQRVILRSIDVFVVIGLLLSHIVYLKLTPPARDWLVAFIPWFGRFF